MKLCTLHVAFRGSRRQTDNVTQLRFTELPRQHEQFFSDARHLRGSLLHFKRALGQLRKYEQLKQQGKEDMEFLLGQFGNEDKPPTRVTFAGADELLKKLAPGAGGGDDGEKRREHGGYGREGCIFATASLP